MKYLLHKNIPKIHVESIFSKIKGSGTLWECVGDMEASDFDIFTYAAENKYLLIVNGLSFNDLFCLNLKILPSTIFVDNIENENSIDYLATIINSRELDLNNGAIVALSDKSYRLLPLREGIKISYAPSECGFDIDGFLPAYLLNKMFEMNDPIPRLADSCIKLNRMALMRISELEYEADQEAKMFSALLFTRSTSTFESSIILATLGMEGEARSQLRDCIESSIIGYALSVTPHLNVVQRLKNLHHEHYKKLKNSIKLKPDHMVNIYLDELLQKISVGTGKDSVNLYELAECSGIKNIYDAIFRFLSADASHTTIDSLQKVAEISKDNPKLVRANMCPNFSNLGYTLLVGIVCIMTAFKGVQKMFPQKEIDLMLNLHESEIDGFINTMFASELLKY